MIFIILFYFIYKNIFTKKIILEKRQSLPKICVIIKNDNINEIIHLLKLQTYPKKLFDVYIFSDKTFNTKFNVFKYNKNLIKDYDLISIINSTIDLNYLHYTAKDYLNGYDIIMGIDKDDISNTLIQNLINNILGNKIISSNFSFIFSLYKNNILDIKEDFLLKRFLSNKTNLININTSIKSKNIIINKNSFIKINPLDKRKFYFKLYIFILISLIIILTNNIIFYIIYLYLFICIYNFIFMYKNNIISIRKIPFFFIDIIKYYIKFLTFRINNKRSNINTIKT